MSASTLDINLRSGRYTYGFIAAYIDEIQLLIDIKLIYHQAQVRRIHIPFYKCLFGEFISTRQLKNNVKADLYCQGWILLLLYIRFEYCGRSIFDNENILDIFNWDKQNFR